MRSIRAFSALGLVLGVVVALVFMFLAIRWLHSRHTLTPVPQYSTTFPVSSTTTTSPSRAPATSSTPGAGSTTLHLSLSFGGIDRTYLLHVPAGYTATKKYPLMISYHGNGGTGAGQEQKTGFDALADANGFFVAYPDSDPTYEQGTQWQLTGTNNDLDLSKALLQAVESAYSIDTSRVYVSGFSEGGGMAQGLACLGADAIAGMADVSENLSQKFAEACAPSMPITVVLFHGTADPVSPYNGGANGTSGAVTWSAQETANFWVQKDACPAQPVTTQFADTLSDGSHVTDTKELWSGCSGGTSVTFYTINDGGHAWPGGLTNNEQLGPASTGLNASEIIWSVLSNMHR